LAARPYVDGIIRKLGLRKNSQWDDYLVDAYSPANVKSRKFTVALVGTSQAKLHGIGKAAPAFYFPKFSYALEKFDTSLIAYQSPDLALAGLRKYETGRTAVILIYNETYQRDLLPTFSRLCSESNSGFYFYNAPSIAEIIGDKEAAGKFFITNGIPSPREVKTLSEDSKVFSNIRIGSHEPTEILEPGRQVDPKRYNTVFINTAHKFRDRSYYASIRALAVSSNLFCAYIRLRPAGAEASVHAADTPLDADLISYFHETLVTANRQKLIELCRQLGGALGRGFYAHDILPCSETGRLYVCESNFKFDDATYRDHLWPISSDLPVLSEHYTGTIMDLAAKTLIEECFVSTPG
jgi:hypothetical protein